MEKLLSNDTYQKYIADLQTCKQRGGEKASECAEQTMLKYLRDVPGMKDSIYPWINYDWAYDIFVDKKYNKNKTGATPDGTIPALFKNPIAMAKLIKGFTLDSNPDSNSKAGVSDIPDCQGDAGCELLNNIRKQYQDQKPPYPDVFFNKKLDGEMSSSFFIKSGTCPQPKLNKSECLKKQYQWVDNPLYALTPSFLRPPSFLPGSCFKPKYAFIKNNSGLNMKIPKTSVSSANQGINLINKNISKLKGEIPSVINDLLSLAPNNVYSAITQTDTPYISNMNCIESFDNIDLTNNEKLIRYLLIIIFTFFLICVICSKL